MIKSIKLILLFVLATLCGFATKAQYSFVATDITGAEGSVVELPISMNNGDKEIVSFQFDLYLPEGITIQLRDDNVPKAKLSSRASDHIINAALQKDGAYRYLSFSMTNAVYTGSDGEILTTPIILAAAPGDYTIQIKNASITLNNEAKTEIECGNTESIIKITEPETIRYGENQLYVKDLTIEQGKDANLLIGYNSTSEVYGYSAEVVLPSGVSVEDVTFETAVAVKNYVNDWSFETPVLTVSGEQGRKGDLALSGDNIIATVILNTSSLNPGKYTIKVQEQYLSNDDDDYVPETYEAILTVKGSTPTVVALTDGVAYTGSVDIDDVNVTYTRTFAANIWQPLYVPFNMSYDEWKDYGRVAELSCVHAYDDGRTTIEFVSVNSGELLPNVPYVILPTVNGEVTINCSNKTLNAAPEEGSKYIMCCSPRYTFKIYGNYQPISGSTLATYGDPQFKGAYVMTTDNKFKHCSVSSTLKPYRFYFTREKTANGYWNASGRQNAPSVEEDDDDVIYLMVDGEVCGIIDIAADVDYNSAIYDLMGREVLNPSNGIYIKDGKKILYY